jgi:hypothetical protein
MALPSSICISRSPIRDNFRASTQASTSKERRRRDVKAVEPRLRQSRYGAMRVFMDFEASSLSDDSYPIEVGWVFEGGVSETHLITPAPSWTDWDPKAALVHGYSRDDLLAGGEPHDAVARRLVEALTGHALFASAPSWDGKWLSVLLRSAGLPRHQLRLRDTTIAQAEAVADRLGGRLGPDELAAATTAILEQVRQEKAAWPVRHRALDDARQERLVWLRTDELAQAMAMSER